jgi:hypothetical protein
VFVVEGVEDDAVGSKVVLRMLPRPPPPPSSPPGFAFSLFNPRAEVAVQIRRGRGCRHGKPVRPDRQDLYQPTVNFLNGWRKFLPTDCPSPWWHTEESLAKLIFSHINLIDRALRKDITLRRGCQEGHRPLPGYPGS